MSHRRWLLSSPSPPPEHPGIPGPVAFQLLHNRGVAGEVAGFLEPGPALVGDPFLLPGMAVAVGRIRWALRQGQSMAIYGDFDADGLTATALLTQGLARLGAQVIPYIPHRFDEGYGLNQPALERLFSQGVRLVITADTGTTAPEEVAWAQAQGLDMVITDHHTPSTRLPPALAVLNPRRQDSLYPFPHLAGVGVALKLLQALGVEPASDGLGLVALGTVADMMPLVGENRYLVKEGLRSLNRQPPLGVAHLMAEAGLAPGQVDTEAISFGLAPRLNAPGRLAHARIAYQLLTTTSTTEAGRCAAELEVHNRERQRLTEEVWAKARERLLALCPLPPLIMLGDPAFSPGVVGIAASRLVEEFYRPVVLYQEGEQVCRGSARGIPEFNLVSALARCQPWLLRFGGHPQAAGFTARREHLPHLRAQLLAVAEEALAGVDLRPGLAIDAQVSLGQLTSPLLSFIARMAPFGPGNPPPIFLSSGVTVEEARPLGSQGRHLRLWLRHPGMSGRRDGVLWGAVAFGLGEVHGPPLPKARVDIVYSLGVNPDPIGGEEYLELRLLDYSPSGA